MSTPASSDFFERVWEVVRHVPYGMVTTYGDIARHLGMASAARTVGYAMNAVPHAERFEIPCHRVVNRNGELTGRMHFETPFVMRERLEAEGVTFIGDAVDMTKHHWKP